MARNQSIDSLKLIYVFEKYTHVVKDSNKLFELNVKKVKQNATLNTKMAQYKNTRTTVPIYQLTKSRKRSVVAHGMQQ